MTERVNHEELMRYLDGELTPEAKARVERAVAESTELRREVAVYRAIKEDLGSLPLGAGGAGRSIWDAVNRKLTRPVGWLLMIVGALAWVTLGVHAWVTTPGELVEKLATGAVVIGILLLLASVIWDRYVEYLTDPYRDVHR